MSEGLFGLSDVFLLFSLLRCSAVHFSQRAGFSKRNGDVSTQLTQRMSTSVTDNICKILVDSVEYLWLPERHNLSFEDLRRLCPN